MKTVRDILAIKGTHVETIGPHDTVLEAALRMNAHKIGALAVVEKGELVGIITERDLLGRVIVPRRDPAATLVEDVMSTEVVCCQLNSRIEEVRGTMKTRRIRHLPVVGDDSRKMLGLVSLGDLNALQAHEQEVTIHVLEEYIQGRA